MQNNRDQLIWLMHETGWSSKTVAQILEEQAGGRPCSDRTVRSWLSTSDSRHTRPCPDWVVELLCAWLKKQGQDGIVMKLQQHASSAA